MLAELVVRDLGVIADLSLVLGQGTTALTGETGAGKTLLVDALALLAGGRADPTAVRAGAEHAEVEGRFLLGDDEVVVRRVVPRDGRSRAYLRGQVATATDLASWAATAFDLHGQHAHQALLTRVAQRAALDRFAGVDLSPVTDARRRLREIEAELSSLGGDEGARARELDLLTYELDEIESAAIAGPDEDERLAAAEALLAGAAGSIQAGGAALDLLHGDGGALDLLAQASSLLEAHQPLGGLAARLEQASVEVADTGAELRKLVESIDEDPAAADAVRARRKVLHDLRRKHGGTLADVLERQAELADRIEALRSHDAVAARLGAEARAAASALEAAEAVVGDLRRAAAPRLACAVVGQLRSLGMGGAQVEVAVGSGVGDDVTFLLAANPGAPAAPLSKVASGGELARVMLALRLSLVEDPSTLVFDEVDAGIGGSAAVAVGRALAELGKRHQVLVVTHLPQVAAAADHQVVVSKSVEGDSALTTAELVVGERRVEELARMLAGEPDSDAARVHASELLSSRAVRG